MNGFKFTFSSAYRRGWNDAKNRGFVCNPYEEQAIEDNADRGLGNSPDWQTKHRPFLDWEDGQSDWAIDRWAKGRSPKPNKEAS